MVPRNWGIWRPARRRSYGWWHTAAANGVNSYCMVPAKSRSEKAEIWNTELGSSVNPQAGSLRTRGSAGFLPPVDYFQTDSKATIVIFEHVIGFRMSILPMNCQRRAIVRPHPPFAPAGGTPALLYRPAGSRGSKREIPFERNLSPPLSLPSDGPKGRF